ncbi:hypothetical protein G7Y89_g11653 [Cudoniella acicularis]|uniref:Uncharacterized protein n=1 Tax=Cudoniella acicularis TaxID=354080 RepID=A0A8H4RE50_9HELO|nr:hypothetical protein G7Y89_g11653 [Cudoniella acicularis]
MDPYITLQHAIQRGDHDGIIMLLDYSCPLFPSRDLPDRFPAPSCDLSIRPPALTSMYESKDMIASDIVSKTIDLLGTHRRRLRDLAREFLTSKEQLELGVNNEVVLDASAVPVYDILVQIGINVPPFLRPYGQKSIYHSESLTVEVAEQLYKAGFRTLEARDDSVPSPMLFHALRVDYGSQGHIRRIIYTLIEWLLKHSLIPIYDEMGLQRRILHALSRQVAIDQANLYQAGEISLFARLNDVCGSLTADSCSCFCSSYGCMPIHTFLKTLLNYYYTLQDRKHSLKLWIDLNSLRDSVIEVYYAEVCRFEIFNRLGMAHTCCKEDRSVWGRSSCPLTNEERQELHEEDAELREQLEDLLQTYKKTLNRAFRYS